MPLTLGDDRRRRRLGEGVFDDGVGGVGVAAVVEVVRGPRPVEVGLPDQREWREHRPCQE